MLVYIRDNFDDSCMSFHRTATIFMILFLGILVGGAYIALGRKSGNTGMDMGKIHLLRAKKVES